MDPDDWIRANGAEAILKSADSAISLIDFKIDTKDVKTLSSAERSQFVNDILFAIAGIDDSIIRNSILKNISQRLHIDENELLKRLKREQTRQRTRVQEEQVNEQPLEFSSLIQKAQLILVKLLASDDPQIRQLVRDNIVIELFSERILKKLAEILLPLYGDITFSSIIDQFENKQERELVTKILMEEKPQEDPKQEITDCINVLEAYPIKEKIKATRFKIRELEQRGEDPIDVVMEEALLQQKLRDLK